MTKAHALQSAVAPAGWDDFFTRVEGELRTLARSVNDLQQFLAPLVGEIASRDPGAMTRLQDLDLLEQSLHGLSDLMSGLDASVAVTDAEALMSNVKEIRLAELARRLNPHAAPNRGTRLEASVLDLF